MVFDQRDEYRAFLQQHIRPTYLPTATIQSGRALRLRRFRENLKQSWQETKFT